MHSKAENMKDRFNDNAEDEGSLEKFGGIKSATLGSESSSNEFSSLKPQDDGLGAITEFSTVATQTSLTWIKRFDDSNQKSMYKRIRNQMSIVQSTLVHPGPTTSRGVLQMSTSSSSNKSSPRNEILTVITNYENAHSVSEDVIQRDDTLGLNLHEQDTYEPLYTMNLTLPNAESMGSNVFIHRTDHRPWNIMRLLNNHFRCMSTANDELETTRPYMGEDPPTYSTIYATRATGTNNWRLFRSTNEYSFVAPIPPPSYAQAQGICLASYSTDHLLPISPNTSRQWSSRPTTTVCPRCTIIVVTTIQVRRSINTYATTVALFLCGCWPCFLIPYCMNTCKNVDHYCPVCHAYLGTYRPC